MSLSKIVAGLVLLAGFASTAIAERALVIDPEGPCTVADGNLFDEIAAGITPVFVTSNDSRQVVTHSARNNTIYVCKLSNVPNDTGSAVRYDYQLILDTLGIPYPCVLYIDGQPNVTYDWEQQISASGKGTLTCRLKD